MISISEDDLPIDVVAKLITAKKPIDNKMAKMMNTILGGDGSTDAFSDEELLEIAEYLEVYARHNIYARNSEWISVKDKMPEPDVCVLVLASGKYKNITLDNAFEIAMYAKKDGWMLENYPSYENPDIKYWMPMPSLPDDLKGE